MAHAPGKEPRLLYAEQNKLADAAKYYGIALRASKSVPTLHLAIADIYQHLYQHLGKHSIAKRHLKICDTLALRMNDTDVLKILDVRGYTPTGDVNWIR